ncbi:DeoR/GlpR transcriptional regulator [Arthrobacter sp. ISL-85]|uniref:hypothetical protein n=1 Tax=Arthrobacter sp. ISL-85 TaxID=2819115 RepID=UPI001BEC2096|nr:hypothetical protein [Arthrobacter sp. ISL-85]MBT2565244.1 DeoR/GlpR transcriptional regulator [Arthrobacter sp. ISL-85]
MDKVEVKLAALEASSSCFLLADSAKFGAVSRLNVAPLERLNAVITDDQLPLEMRDNIRDLGVNVHVAQAETTRTVVSLSRPWAFRPAESGL